MGTDPETGEPIQAGNEYEEHVRFCNFPWILQKEPGEFEWNLWKFTDPTKWYKWPNLRRDEQIEAGRGFMEL